MSAVTPTFQQAVCRQDRAWRFRCFAAEVQRTVRDSIYNYAYNTLAIFSVAMWRVPQYEKTPKGGYDFEITIKYKDDKDLNEIVNEEILREAWSLADYQNCFVDDTYVDALDGSERSW